MAMIFVTGVNVGNMHFQHRPFERLDGVYDSDRGERIAGGIDDDGVGVLPRRLDQIDQFAFVIRLVKGNLEIKPRGAFVTAVLDLRERRGPGGARAPPAD